MKKIIVFGATGNVGSYFVKYASEFFNKDEFQIIASGRRETNVFSQFGVSYYDVDIQNMDSFDKLPVEDIYAVVMLAATIPSYMENYDSGAYLRTNIIGMYNVLEYCRKVSADRIMFSTTVFDISLFAKPGIVLKPDLPRNFSYKGDHAAYVISKNTAVDLIEYYHQEYGLKKFIFRFPTIYGYSPFQYYYPNGIKAMRPLYKMINKAMNSEPLEIWGNPDYAKDMVYVYDCSQMICKAILANRTNGFYNVGTGIPITLQEQFDTIIEVFSPKDNPSKISYNPKAQSGGGYLMDIQNAKDELDYNPVYSCRMLFEDIKKEMEINRFYELRMPK